MKYQIPDFVTHYYDLEVGAYKSMTDEGYIKAQEIFADLKEKGNNAKSSFPNSYPDLRREVENWLLTAFIKKGGRPARQNPIYTILGSCDWLLQWYANGGKENIPLSLLKNKQVSFTYPDSMVSYQLHFQKKELKMEHAAKNYHGQVYLLHELNDVISEYGLPAGKIRNGKPELDMYIEIQIWEDLS